VPASVAAKLEVVQPVTLETIQLARLDLVYSMDLEIGACILEANLVPASLTCAASVAAQAGRALGDVASSCEEDASAPAAGVDIGVRCASAGSASYVLRMPSSTILTSALNIGICHGLQYDF
jgi:hypothetical protein